MSLSLCCKKLCKETLRKIRVKNPKLRQWLNNWDGTARWLQKYHEGVREDGYMILEIGSWFVPLGELTKLRYLKYAGQLIKLKRGIHFTAGAVDLTTQLIINRGDITKVNFVATASSTLIGNPFLSSIPGAFACASISNGVEFRNVSNPDVYKSILVNTLGNIGSDKLGGAFKTETTIPGGQFFGEILVTTGAGAFEEMTPLKKEE